MNRSFTSFLLFLGVLLVAAAGGVWWLGTDVVELALDDERRDAPYQLLQLVEPDQPGGRYAAEFTRLVQNEEGDLIWRGRLERLLEGRTEDEWADLMLFGLPKGSDLVQLITSPEYRELTTDRRLLLLGVPGAPGDFSEAATLVLWLQTRPELMTDDTDLLRIMAGVDEFEGSVLLDSPIDQVAGTGSWNHLVVLRFPDSRRAQAWFRKPASETERTLAIKALDRQAWLLVSAAHLRSS
jgi:uncharacterized protein (DUF1330 family)